MDIDIEELRNTIAMKDVAIKEHKEEIEGLEKVRGRLHFYHLVSLVILLFDYFVLIFLIVYTVN